MNSKILGSKQLVGEGGLLTAALGVCAVRRIGSDK
jgi:hypothetical protein